MKKLWLITLALAAFAATASAQKIALGERVPEIKVTAWVLDSIPAAAPYTYIEFFHTSNQSGTRSLDKLREISNKLDTKLRVIVVAQESADKIAALLTPYVSKRIGVGFDTSGRIFLSFGVQYVPFGVLTDAKNRALWMGNTLQLTPEIILNAK